MQETKEEAAVRSYLAVLFDLTCHYWNIILKAQYDYDYDFKGYQMCYKLFRSISISAATICIQENVCQTCKFPVGLWEFKKVFYKALASICAPFALVTR